MERVAFDVGAGGRIRTPDLLITNQLLYRLSYTSTSTGDDYHNKPGRVCQQIYRPEEAFFSPEISFLHKERRYDPCGDGGGIPGRRAAPQSARGGADKSLRNGKANLEDAYAEVDKGEVWLLGCDIPEYLQANRMNHKPKRSRKLLLHRREIMKLAGRTTEKGITLVPLQIHFRRGMAKVEIAIARGRKSYDKRQAIKSQEAKRDIARYQRRGGR